MSETLQFVPPMLARTGEVFDSADHLFELMWAGRRAQAVVDSRGLQLLDLHGRPLEQPGREIMAALDSLPRGSVVEGVLIDLADGDAIPADHPPGHPDDYLPHAFLAFDLLHEDYRSVMELPLHERRRRLEHLLLGADDRILLSEGVVGAGRALFESACVQELEGIVAKNLFSPYESGLRTGSWVSIKRSLELPCVVIGYLEKEGELSGLVIAAQQDGILVPVGRIASGLADAQREGLLDDLRTRRREHPVVPVGPVAGPLPRWVDPGPYLLARYVERTREGHLRSPVISRILQH